MPLIRDDQKHLVQQSTDIVQLVGEHLALRPKGKEFLGLCPFHDDKNPSMHVSPTKQIFKCFVCGSGGDVFSWMTKYHKMTFPEALRFLAERAGITLQETGDRRQESDGAPTERQRIADVNDKALRFFQAMYRHDAIGQIARQYVAQRGLSAEMVEAFQIGYAPDEWDSLAKTTKRKSWPAADFIRAGLIAMRGQDGATARPDLDHCYDKLRHRLIFPICDALGRPIAFGGRVLAGSTRQDKSDAKYLNSPETVLFNKSATLYGLHLAKKSIIDSRTVVIVEGYTDVIACHQAGECNVVATLGTALTSQHARELRKYADKVVLLFDGDEAGQRAADRAIEVFLTENLDVFAAVLPGAKDPADLLATPDGPDVWRQTIDHAQDALAFQFARLREQYEATDTMTGRQRIIETYLQKLAELGLGKAGVLRRAMVIARLSELLHLGENDIEQMIKRLDRSRSQRPVTAPPPVPTTSHGGEVSPFLEDDDGDAPDRFETLSAAPRRLRLAERQLIGGLLRNVELFHYTLRDGRTLDEAIATGDLFTEHGRTIYQMISDYFASAPTDAPRETALATLLADSAELGRDDLAAVLTDCEAAAEQAAGDDAERLDQYVGGAAEAIAAHHRERQLDATRDTLVTAAGASAVDADEQTRLLRAFAEHRRSNPSPLRIGRVGVGAGAAGAGQG